MLTVAMPFSMLIAIQIGLKLASFALIAILELGKQNLKLFVLLIHKKWNQMKLKIYAFYRLLAP